MDMNKLEMFLTAMIEFNNNRSNHNSHKIFVRRNNTDLVDHGWTPILTSNSNKQFQALTISQRDKTNGWVESEYVLLFNSCTIAYACTTSTKEIENEDIFLLNTEEDIFSMKVIYDMPFDLSTLQMIRNILIKSIYQVKILYGVGEENYYELEDYQ